MSTPLLQITKLGIRFGGLQAVSNFSFSIEPGELKAVIGPNGAGKTTVFNCISGFYKPTSGTISLAGRNITGQPSHRIARLGLVRTFQNIRLFGSMTVLENLLVAQHNQVNTNLLSGLLQTKNYRQREQQALATGKDWLERMQLVECANLPAENLSYGQQRKLEIARCMVTNPKLLLLDEPAAGLNPSETVELTRMIRSLRDEFGIAVLLIEHDMQLVMDISEQIVVLDQGHSIASGTPKEIQQNSAVIRAYLGEE